MGGSGEACLVNSAFTKGHVLRRLQRCWSLLPRPPKLGLVQRQSSEHRVHERRREKHLQQVFLLANVCAETQSAQKSQSRLEMLLLI